MNGGMSKPSFGVGLKAIVMIFLSYLASLLLQLEIAF